MIGAQGKHTGREPNNVTDQGSSWLGFINPWGIYYFHFNNLLHLESGISAFSLITSPPANSRLGNNSASCALETTGTRWPTLGLVLFRETDFGLPDALPSGHFMGAQAQK